MGSETYVKEPFKGLLSASTQHCVPDSQVQATPHSSVCDGEGYWLSSPGREQLAQEDL